MRSKRHGFEARAPVLQKIFVYCFSHPIYFLDISGLAGAIAELRYRIGSATTLVLVLTLASELTLSSPFLPLVGFDSNAANRCWRDIHVVIPQENPIDGETLVLTTAPSKSLKVTSSKNTGNTVSKSRPRKIEFSIFRTKVWNRTIAQWLYVMCRSTENDILYIVLVGNGSTKEL